MNPGAADTAVGTTTVATAVAVPAGGTTAVANSVGLRLCGVQVECTRVSGAHLPSSHLGASLSGTQLAKESGKM